jgi:hypothetical protein
VAQYNWLLAGVLCVEEVPLTPRNNYIASQARSLIHGARYSVARICTQYQKETAIIVIISATPSPALAHIQNLVHIFHLVQGCICSFYWPMLLVN